MPNVRACLVSFTDSEGLEQVEVAAGSLFEAAALAIAEFKRCVADGCAARATRLSVIVKAPTTRHDMTSHESAILAYEHITSGIVFHQQN